MYRPDLQIQNGQHVDIQLPIMKTIQALLSISATFAVTTTQATTWDVVNDFSAARNPNGAWTYGYYSLYGALGVDLPSGPVTFTVLTSSQVGSSYVSWSTPSEISALNIIKLGNENRLALIAGLVPQSAFYAPVIRWTAPTDGNFFIKADFSYLGIGAASFDVSQAGLRVDDTTLTYTYIGGTDGLLHINENISLSAGQYVDFFVAKGRHSIGLNSTISMIPEPSTYLLLIVGLATFRKRLLTTFIGTPLRVNRSN